jgi:hypothetical protein
MKIKKLGEAIYTSAYTRRGRKGSIAQDPAVSLMV